MFMLFCACLKLSLVSNNFSKIHIGNEVFIETLHQPCLYSTLMLSKGFQVGNDFSSRIFQALLHLLSLRSQSCYLRKLDAIFISEPLYVSSGFPFFSRNFKNCLFMCSETLHLFTCIVSGFSVLGFTLHVEFCYFFERLSLFLFSLEYILLGCYASQVDFFF